MIYLPIASGKIEVMRYLIGKGADINVRDVWNKSPLSRTREGYHKDAATLLETLGAVESP